MMFYDKIEFNSNPVFFDNLSANEQSDLIHNYAIAAAQGLKQLKENDLSNTIVHDVIRLHSSKLFRIVFQNGSPFLNTPNAEKSTPLLEAVAAGDEELVMEMLKHDVTESINLPNKDGITPLYAAVDAGNLRLVKLLLKHGADSSITALTNKKMSSLHAAATLKSSKILEILLKHGAKNLIGIPCESGLTPLDRAIICGHVHSVRRMLEARPDLAQTLNQPDSVHGITAIQRGGRSGNVEMMQLLLDYSGRTGIQTNNNAFFTSEDLNVCLVEHSGNYLEKIPFKEVHFPLIIAQNLCNVMVQLKDGKLLKIPNADAKKVRNFLLEKKDGPKAVAQEGLNFLTLYLNPWHGFVRLECDHCDQGKSYNKNLGFYSKKLLTEDKIKRFSKESVFPFLGVSSFGKSGSISFKVSHLMNDYSGVLNKEDTYEKDSDIHNYLKITFHVNNNQAMSVIDTINKVNNSCNGDYEEACAYRAVERNCVDFEQEIFKSTGGSGDFANYFTNKQLSFGGIAVNYVFTRSRKVNYFNYENKKFNTISNIVAASYGWAKPAENQFVDFERPLIKVSPLNVPMIKNEDTDEKEFSQNIYPGDIFLLNLVLGKAAINTYNFVTGVCKKVFGSKVTQEEYENWYSPQKIALAGSIEKLDLIWDQVEDQIESIDAIIDQIKEDGVYTLERKIILDHSRKERSSWVKLRNQVMDLEFDAVELEDELTLLKRSSGLPARAHLKDLEVKISTLSDQTTEAISKLNF
jgi:ankyrin repeat protein